MPDKNKTNFDDLLIDNLDDLSLSIKSEEKNKKGIVKEEQVESIKAVLENFQSNIKKFLDSLKTKEVSSDVLIEGLKKIKESAGLADNSNAGDRIIEGIFTGEAMVAADGKQYNVPANYASKSKLVEGDILKLTITRDGSFIYKQIGPIERKQMIATLAKDESTDEWHVVTDKKRWRVLTASVTYFHGEAGDEVVILIPKDSKSNWAAVENVIKK